MALTRFNRRSAASGLTRREFGASAATAIAVATTALQTSAATAQPADGDADGQTVALPPFALPGVLVLGEVCVDCDAFFAVDDAQP